tara:strand:- start:322 stop:546 length:225 start_codon:yes stop_codon:yes gene_type:complete
MGKLLTDVRGVELEKGDVIDYSWYDEDNRILRKEIVKVYDIDFDTREVAIDKTLDDWLDLDRHEITIVPDEYTD